MSKSDKFGLISGIVGLVADALAIAAVFLQQQSGPASSVFGWLLLPIAGIYGTIVIGFYYRKFSAQNAKQNNKSGDLYPPLSNPIEKGAKLTTIAVGIPLSAAYMLALCFKIKDDLTFAGHPFFISVTLWICFSFIFGCILAFVLNRVAFSMYAGYDLAYKPNEK